MKKLFKYYIVDAILLIVFGAILLFYPQATLDFVIKWGGIFLLILGAFKLLMYIIKKDERKTSSLIVSIIQIVIGLLMLLAPDLVKIIVPVIMGILIAYGAIISLVRSIRLRNEVKTAKPVLILSIITLALAVIVCIYMIANPTAAAGILVRLIGVGILLEGITMLIAFSMHEIVVEKAKEKALIKGNKKK